MDPKVKNVLKEIKAYLIITFGLLCYTAGWSIFLLPNNLVGGGVSGIGAVIQYITGIPVSYSFFAINLILLLIALKVLGKGFGIKTVFAIIIASLAYEMWPMIIPEEFIAQMSSNGNLLCTIIGGIMTGVGIGITFNQGGSTGGTDIVVLMINKYYNISPGRLLLLIDIFIVASSLLVPTDQGIGARMATLVYGYILIFVCGSALDMFISGSKQSVQLFIFSKKYEEIADRVTYDLHRGVTVLNGTGWFTKKEGKVLMVIMRKTEVSFIMRMIREIDKDAFMSMGAVSGVYGEGFDQIRK
ncbi:MAG: YitT family protein [Bacteroidales bacterium]|nr:YitT family protein [Bacteroidales bacterium]